MAGGTSAALQAQAAQGLAYRNTREIAAFAASLVGGSGFVDIESGTRGRMDVAEVLRDGVVSVVERFSSTDAHDVALVARVRELLATPGAHPGDFGVLAMRTRDVAACVRVLTSAGVPVLDLASYDGRVARGVKVGTVKRAKGLEFKHVLVAHTPAWLVSGEPAEADSAEGFDIVRRELYVASTRARDGLWLGLTS